MSEVQVITKLDELLALEVQWAGLVSRCERATALQHHEFIAAWWRHFGAGKELRIHTVRNGETLLAAAPLQLSRRRVGGLQHNVLEFVGMPDDLLRPNFLVDGDNPECVGLLVDSIFSRQLEWDLLQLDELDHECVFLDNLKERATRFNLTRIVAEFDPCPYLEKQGRSWSDFLKSSSVKFARRLRQSRNRFERAGHVAYESVSAGADMQSAIQRFFAVERGSWKAAANIDVGDDRRYEVFYSYLLSHRSAGFCGHAIIQTIDGLDSAATIGIESGGVYCALQIAHNQKFNRYSPGTLLEAYEMEWFFGNQKLYRYEFLSGALTNKRRWTEYAVPTIRVLIHRKTLRLGLGRTLEFKVLPALDQLADRLRRKSSDRTKPFKSHRRSP